MRSPRLSPTAYRRLVAATLASLVFIMVTGAAVRLTQSGLGCSTWPSCDADSFAPRSASDWHGMVEWVNRLITGAVMVFTLAAVLGARWRPYRRDLFLLSLGLPAWVFANALVGALVVVLDLSPVSVIGHFLLSLGAVANAVVLLDRAGREPGEAPALAGGARSATPSMLRACWGLVAAASVVIVSGTVVTGSGPHAGDDSADRLPLAVHSAVRVHGICMVVFLALTVWVIRRAQRGDASPVVGHRLHQLLVVLVAQAAIGYWQYFTGVPALLVGFHVFGAALVWIAVLRVLLAAGAPEPEVEAAGFGIEPVRATMGTW
ncbi:MAG TPA: COX15/CtaA family protein [Acidimicrobiales bacterium]|nr:COX15/CtaA family protein [Acidimicrobiales bacterium]